MKTKFSKIKAIIKREYLVKVKSKAFLLGTVLAPLGLLVFIGIMAFVGYQTAQVSPKKIAVVDSSGVVMSKLPKDSPVIYFKSDKAPKVLKKEALAGKIDGFLIIPKNFPKVSKVSLYTAGGSGLTFVKNVESSIDRIAREIKLFEAGLNPRTLAYVNEPIRIDAQKITEKGEEQDFTEIYAAIGYALGFVIYMFMFIYGGFVTRGVIEEKTNRIVEILASSAKPFEIMMGKIIGIGAVGLTQILFWIILFLGALAVAQPILLSFVSNAATTPLVQNSAAQTGEYARYAETISGFLSGGIIIAFLFYFLGGYFLYATLFAAIGSAVDQDQDAQQLMTPVSILIVFPMLFIPLVMSNPDSTLSAILSLFPFFTPILMIVRVAAGSPPFWQIALSAILLIATFIGAVWVSAKIYRVGILMYGKKPSIKDLIKWARY